MRCYEGKYILDFRSTYIILKTITDYRLILVWNFLPLIKINFFFPSRARSPLKRKRLTPSQSRVEMWQTAPVDALGTFVFFESISQTVYYVTTPAVMNGIYNFLLFIFFNPRSRKHASSHCRYVCCKSQSRQSAKNST